MLELSQEPKWNFRFWMHQGYSCQNGSQNGHLDRRRPGLAPAPRAPADRSKGRSKGRSKDRSKGRSKDPRALQAPYRTPRACAINVVPMHPGCLRRTRTIPGCIVSVRPMSGWVPCRAQGAQGEARAEDSMDGVAPCDAPHRARRLDASSPNASNPHAWTDGASSPHDAPVHGASASRTHNSKMRTVPWRTGARPGPPKRNRAHRTVQARTAQGKTLRGAGRTMEGAPVQGARCGQREKIVIMYGPGDCNGDGNPSDRRICRTDKRCMGDVHLADVHIQGRRAPSKKPPGNQSGGFTDEPRMPLFQMLIRAGARNRDDRTRPPHPMAKRQAAHHDGHGAMPRDSR